ncbi:hypothetical protein D3C84_1298710 [compost metagenome]
MTEAEIQRLDLAFQQRAELMHAALAGHFHHMHGVLYGVRRDLLRDLGLCRRRPYLGQIGLDAEGIQAL